jgi:hypothetical protein
MLDGGDEWILKRRSLKEILRRALRRGDRRRSHRASQDMPSAASRSRHVLVLRGPRERSLPAGYDRAAALAESGSEAVAAAFHAQRRRRPTGVAF